LSLGLATLIATIDVRQTLRLPPNIERDRAEEEWEQTLPMTIAQCKRVNPNRNTDQDPNNKYHVIVNSKSATDCNGLEPHSTVDLDGKETEVSLINENSPLGPKTASALQPCRLHRWRGGERRPPHCGKSASNADMRLSSGTSAASRPSNHQSWPNHLPRQITPVIPIANS